MSQIKVPEVVAAPTHGDFCSYLPWACLQFGVPAVVTINKVIEGGPNKPYSETSKFTKSRKISSSLNLRSMDDKESPRNTINPKIHISAVFNNANKLVRLRFEDKNHTIPREVMKVTKLIIHKQIDLKRFEIKSGVDKYILHEISQIIKVSHITEICLDNSFVREGNYAVLLETPNIHYISLSKCKINDKVIEEMCKNLEHPKAASKSLVAIVLSTNMITDDGAKFVAEALRSNRKLAYINLADNTITDEGARFIFDTLVEFPMRTEELVAAKNRRFAYVKEKNTTLFEKVENLTMNDDKEPIKDKLNTSSDSSRKRKPSRSTLKSTESSKASVATVGLDHERVVRQIENSFEDYQDPFHFPNIYIKEGVAYCEGNNSLRYLNMAYNNLTYMSLKKILDVLIHQKVSDTGRGLLDVKIDGNYLPVDCEEMQELDVLLCRRKSSDELSIQKASPNKKRSKNSKQRRDTE